MNACRIITLDVGNSAADIGLFEDANLITTDFLPSSADSVERICLIAERWHQENELEHVMIASVVPALGDLLAVQIEQRLRKIPIMVEDIKTQLLPLRVDRPETVGVDRIVNCYAAVHLYGSPAVVISLGTATTFEAISADGRYIGGAIAPGVNISLEALTRRAALLPPIDLHEKPERIIGKNTVEHMKSGIFFGTVSMIEGMARRMKSIVGDQAKVIATGGMSSIFAQEGVFDVHEPFLTLKGLELIHRHRCPSRD
ncbi:MAG: type III pantothenate kinase [Candidatus Omnitrophota bacterium]|jgi:type III pantothenate kinase|nr:MAG: type III pantothenate kinase [Candidatus Omnitrophota bacterium]